MRGEVKRGEGKEGLLEKGNREEQTTKLHIIKHLTFIMKHKSKCKFKFLLRAQCGGGVK